MNQPGQVDPNTLNKFMTWQAFASIMMWMLCVGVAMAPDTSKRTAIVLAVGATLYVIITAGSGFWTGYTKEYRRVTPKEDPTASFLKPAGMLSFGASLYLVHFSNSYFIEGNDLSRALLGGLFFGGAVAGGMYLVFAVARKKK